MVGIARTATDGAPIRTYAQLNAGQDHVSHQIQQMRPLIHVTPLW